MPDVLAAAIWYLLSSLLGALALPLTWRLFHRLPDRGYGFSRSLGLLAVGYLLWLMSSLGVLRNTRASILGLLMLTTGASLLALRGQSQALVRWLRDHKRTVLTAEILFLAAFALWTFVRANSPEIVATEKPMELAFINSVVHSDRLPPADPWLSGYAISYYYFGFILVGLLTELSGVAAGVAFNLTNALWFALTLLGAFTIAHNLIAARAKEHKPQAALLGPLFVAITGNLEGFLDMLHSRHLFWRRLATGEWVSGFWRWLDIKTLVEPPLSDPRWIPTRHWWWWRASRVVRDLNLAGLDHEVIDEFPFFSFLLADNHPHVLALPFVLMALGYALHLYLGGRRRPQPGFLSLEVGRYRTIAFGGSLLLAGLVGGGQLAVAANSAPVAMTTLIARLFLSVSLAILGYNLLLQLAAGRQPSFLEPIPLLTAAWLFGSLAFLNTWDFPIYLSLVFFILLYTGRATGGWARLRTAATTSVALVLLGVLLYLPWYPTFSSQAGGVLPNLAFPTQPQQFLVMFAPLLTPIAVWLVVVMRRRPPRSWKPLIGVAVGLPLALLLASWALAGLIFGLRGQPALAAALDQIGVNALSAALSAILSRRLLRSGTALILGAVVASVWILLRRSSAESGRSEAQEELPVWPYVAMLTGVGALLVLGPEFLYLKDLFGTRMNTVFKFYFAAWILWGVAAAYAGYELWPRPGQRWRVARMLIFVPLLLGLFYPAMSLVTRTEGFSPSQGRTLDGTAHLERDQPADAKAIGWIKANVHSGVIAEAVGGSYTQYARVSTHTGLTTVLGWEFHEVQWRGSADLQGSRRSDIERLYRSTDWREAREVVERYGIDYVYIGPLERSTYGVPRESKFDAFMVPIYRDGEVVIYATPEKADLP